MKKKITALSNNLRLGFCFACRKVGIPGFAIHRIHLERFGLCYIPIPKNACSSIKHALYEIEFDRPFDYAYHGEWGYADIHDYYKKRPGAFTSAENLRQKTGQEIFAVIRDPVKRLISCYRNRVVDLKDLEKSRIVLEHDGLPVEPDINTFILNLEHYRSRNKIIEHHSRPQSDFLDDSLDYLDCIFRISELDELKSMLRKYRPGLEMRAEKSGGPSFGLADLSREALDKAVSFYERDYQLLSEYYSPERILESYKQTQNG